MTEGTCFDCRFWEPDGDEGLCHRNAPQPLVTSDSLEDSPAAYFPSTCRGDWCGDFLPKRQEEAQ